jgi:hypothetical protein
MRFPQLCINANTTPPIFHASLDAHLDACERLLECRCKKVCGKPELAPNWSSGAVALMHEDFHCITNTEAYRWQLIISEATLLGLDLMTFAATGSGKTIPQILPLMAHPNEFKMVLILSLLKELQQDQVSQNILLLLYKSDLHTVHLLQEDGLQNSHCEWQHLAEAKLKKGQWCMH